MRLKRERFPEAGVEELSKNKMAQLALGVFMIAVAAKLWMSSWFSLRLGLSPPAAGFSGPLDLISVAIDSAALVGITGFAVLKLIASSLGWFRGSVASVVSSATEEREIDLKKLEELFVSIDQRLSRLESAHPELLPPVPPTVEDLVKIIEDLKRQIGGSR
jgi:hypothetical protein